MQRPKWLTEWKIGKNLIEGTLTIDSADLKVAEVSFNKNLMLIAVGNSTKLGSTGLDREINLKWKLFYDSTIFLKEISKAKLKNLLASLVYLLSADSSIYNEDTEYIAHGDKPTKGNAPVLTDCELLKKIEEARKQKFS